MIPTFLDLRTGRTAKGYDMSFFWWAEGNGSCDCNRVCCFEGVSEEMHAAQRRAHPELQEWQTYCLGAKRFIAIDVEGDLASYDHEGKDRIAKTKEECLAAMNAGYGE